MSSRLRSVDPGEQLLGRAELSGAELKPQIPWLRVFVEGVVIVGSILLAFGIDAAWEGRQERALELEYAERLKADLSGDTARMGTGIRNIEDKMSVLKDLSNPDGSRRCYVTPATRCVGSGSPTFGESMR